MLNIKVIDCIQTYIRVFGPAPDLFLVDCRQITILYQTDRAVEVIESQNIALVLHSQRLSRIRVANSRLISFYADGDALREPIETENSLSIAFFSIFDIPPNATAESVPPTPGALRAKALPAN